MSFNLKKCLSLKNIADLMDTRFEGPFGIRFGLDSLIGLIPIWGDTITKIISAGILLRAAYIGYPPAVLIKMGVNLLIEWILEAIPILGNIADLFWKTNKRNLELMKAYDLDSDVARQSRNSVIYMTVIIFSLLVISIIGFIYFSFYLFQLMFG